MQLVICSIALFLFVLTHDVKAQIRKLNLSDRDTTDHKNPVYEQSLYEKPDWKTIDIDFLSSYYEQDGNNAAVTGGIGTEQLSDFTQKVIVSVPISPKISIIVDAGYDYYSSASTDNIDNIAASASAHDMRVHGNLGGSFSLDNQHSIGLRLGGSNEYDYTSLNGGINYGWIAKDQNTQLQFSAQAFLDRWELYYPQELRRQGRLVDTDKRRSYNASLGFTQVLNKKMQLSVQMEGIYMNGLLSTPFHRVYFNNESAPRIERLPSTRLKIPIGIKLNSYLSEKLISRLYYRYYSDDWGVKAHTASIELPYKINRFFAVYPFYRYHTQTASDHFGPYATHSLEQVYYTSDYDLSALQSHSYGAGISISPATGITQMKVPFTRQSSIKMKSIDLKVGHYTRSTGLTSNIISIGVSFRL